MSILSSIMLLVWRCVVRRTSSIFLVATYSLAGEVIRGHELFHTICKICLRRVRTLSMADPRSFRIFIFLQFKVEDDG